MPMGAEKAVKTKIATMLAIAAVAALGGCAAPNPDAGFISDPYESTNRYVHSLNKGIDTVALRPAAQVYDFVAPELVQHLASNALDTLDLPVAAVNFVLQGDFLAALRTSGRLGLNVVMGAGGLLDPATEMGLPKEETDFGITLARLGVAEGPYLEFPALGPMTGRDLAGRVVDAALNPVSWVAGIPTEGTAGLRAFQVVEARDAYFAAIDRTLYDSEDSYIAARSAYVQLRRRAVAGGVVGSSLPNVFDQ
ncbi:MAG: phospholipid-binding lipoprotein MlaA [Paracoccaceae bacterium]|jgi:phospholipid-binding lipoprotein MlaA